MSRQAEPEVDPVAVISMAGRFPDAADVAQFWKNLCAGRESITHFTGDELIALGRDPRIVRHPRFVGAEGVVEGIELFDAGFFGYSPREAQILDPQHRLCLEAAWHAFDTAGYDPARIGAPVGVYLSAGLSSYLIRNLLPNRELLEVLGGFSVLTHNDKDFLPTSVSYKLGLTGPSMAVGTACSSSLVAVHLAVQSLHAGECDLALAGGVSLQVPMPQGYVYSDDGIYSPDGHCRPFGAGASGTVGGSGTGVVLLKRLSEAVRDGDHVHAVILGSAVNNDGAAKVGYTAPSVEGQTAVIAEAHAMAGVTADEVGYVEAHGTGTSLGDAIEIEALTRAFRLTGTGRGICRIGAVKGNIGHLDAAAGIAGLIKTVLSVEHGIIPATLYCDPPGERLALQGTPFGLSPRTTPWPRAGRRVAGVSAFGIGGSNAHVVLAQGPRLERTTNSRPILPILLSARDESALDEYTSRLAVRLREGLPDLAGVAVTLAGRRSYRYRRAVVAATTDEATRLLQSAPAVLAGAADRPVVLLFAGRVEPGQILPAVREDTAFEAHLRQTGLDLSGLADAGPDAATVAVQYALARTLADYGVRPDAVLGQGAGELAAAAIAGAITPAEAVLMAKDVTPVAVSAAPWRIRMASSSLGRWVSERDGGVWPARLEHPDGLSDALGAVLDLPDAVLLEIGSHRLAALARAHPLHKDGHVVLSGADFAPEPRSELAGCLAGLWTAGIDIAWNAYFGPSRPAKVRVPAYPLRRDRHWMDAPRSGPEESPSLDDLVAGARPAVAAKDEDAAEAMDRLCTALALDYLRGSGIDTSPGTVHSVSDLRERLGVLPAFDRLVRFLLSTLVDDRLAEREGDRLRFTTETVPDAAALAQEITRHHPAQRGLVELLTHCVSRYPQALTVPGHALSVLYPDGRGDLLERTVGDAGGGPDDIDIMMQALCRMATRLADRLGRPLRILEVGTGGGRLTWRLRAELGDRAEYTATDIGPLFLEHLRGEAARRGVDLRLGLLDISRDPVGQGFPERGFDLVVGLDVVHATPDVRAALRNLATLLAPGGLLGVIETTARHRWLSMIWGLSESWWHFRDDLRSTSPLLDPAGWQEAVRSLPGMRWAVLPDGTSGDAVLIAGQVPAGKGHSAGLPESMPGKEPDPADWCYLPGWRRVGPPSEARSAERCLVIAAGPVGETVARGLRNRGAEVTVAASVKGNDFDALLERAPGLILLLDNAEDAPSEAAGLHALIALAQAWGRRAARSPVRLIVATRGAQEVTGADLTRPGQATIQAAVKVIPREYPTVDCRLVDLSEAETTDVAASQLIAEALAAAEEPLVAYRNGRRWLPTFEPVRLPPAGDEVAGLKPGGVYLVCGGLGGIGLSLAEHLAGLPATVVLTRRTPFPPPEQWPGLAANRGTEPDGEVAHRLLAMRARGGTVVVEQADITDASLMRDLVRRTADRFGAITGVVHAAGIADTAGMIQRRTRADTEAAIAAKVAGTLALSDALDGHDPEWILLCSSIGTVLHKLKFGEVGYVAGHDFLQAYAAHRCSGGRPAVLAVAWTDWLEGGMWARAQEQLARRYAITDGSGLRPDTDLLRGITPAEGVDLFRRIVAHRPGPVTVISTQRLDRLLEIHSGYTTEAHAAILRNLTAASGRREAEPGRDFSAPVTATQRMIAGIWSQLLGIEDVGLDDDFFAAGGDSLIALRMLSRVREETGVDHPVSAFFAEPTVRAVAEAVGDGSAPPVIATGEDQEEVLI